jgi:predicted anti-sigma-YlaC factor YlaD
VAIPAGRTMRLIALFLAASLLAGCSLKKRAVNTLADVLSEADRVYLSDDDPELVADALPFNLKTVETLLESYPEHPDLLLMATKSFILYAYGFVEPGVREIPYEDFERAEAIRHRAARLYRRAYRFGLRGLELDHPGLGERLVVEPQATVRELELADVPFAVWTAAALGGAITNAKDDPESTADIAVVGALLNRALELDEDYDEGTIHELLTSYEASRVGGSIELAREHYERALELGPGKHPSIWLSWAETVSVSQQNRVEFLDLVDRTIAFDVERYPDKRLLNVLAQRRARWLRERVDELFLDGDT